MQEVVSVYNIRCPNCTGEHDAVQAIWCSCDPQNPTKLCPFCLTCFCEADRTFKDWFWENAPPSLREERAALKESRMLLGDMLVRAGVITTDQLLRGLKHQKQEGGRIGDVLIALGLLTKDRIDEFLRVQQSVVSFDVSRVVLDLGLVRQVGIEFCRRKRILPLEKDSFKNRTLLTLAMADPADTETINRVQKMCGCQVVAGRSPAETILEVLQTHFPEEPAAPPPAAPREAAPPAPAQVAAPEPAGAEQPAPAVSRPAPAEEEPETHRLAARLIRTGLERGADEVEVSLREDGLHIRYRIGGRTFRAGCPPETDPEALLGALREMAGIAGSGGGRVPIPFGGGEVVVAVEARPETGADTVTVRFSG
jgi:type IV pilus assembly protein PilB